MPSALVHLVFLRTGALVLDRARYATWQDVQGAYDAYMTALGPWTEADVASYFALDYGPDDACCPLSRAALAAFFASGDLRRVVL